MAKKLAKVDAEVMNSLYAAELAKVGMKTAADPISDEKGAPHDDQAFEDHAEYLENIKSALKESGSAEGSKDPNDKVLD
jgi:hypothetical protein